MLSDHHYKDNRNSNEVFESTYYSDDDDGDDRGSGDHDDSFYYPTGQIEKTTSSYCPDILTNLVSENMTPHSISRVGCVMLADISGFTKLSSQLCTQGESGLDYLRHVTNDFLSKVISLIYSFQGDVLYFAGDAVISYFGGGDDVVVTCRNAINCGLLLKDFTLDDLTCHIAISYGEISVGILGGHANDWTYLINGTCVQDLSTCIDLAKSGQLVISETCYTAYTNNDANKVISEESIEFSPVETCFLVTTSSLIQTPPEVTSRELNVNEKILSKFLPRPVVASLSIDTSYCAAGELREVTTVFIKIDSFTDYSTNVLVMQPFFVMAQEELSRCGGFMRQFLIDDKGCVLIAIWGTPTSSFVNASTRALYFSLNVSTKATALGHTCSIGITQGNTFCGIIGSSLRRDYVAIGSTVNMAARLMSKAKGRILLDTNVFQFLDDTVRFGLIKAETMNLKGLEKPITPFTVSTRIMSSSFRKIFERSIASTAINEDLDDPVASFNQLSLFKDMSIVSVECDDDDETDDDGEHVHKKVAIEDNFDKQIVDYLQSSIDKVAMASKETIGSVISITDCSLQCYIVEGAQGFGKTEIAKYLNRLSIDRKVRSFCVRAQESDLTTKFGVLRKLFKTMVGQSSFRTPKEQQSVVLKLLRAAFPTLTLEKIIDDKFPAMKEFLNLSWNLCSSMLKTHGHSTVLRRLDPDTPTLSLSLSQLSRERDIIIHEVFCVLLKDIPCSIIVDDCQYCDEVSWNEFHYMLSMNCPIVLLLTIRNNPLHSKLATSMSGDATMSMESFNTAFRHYQSYCMMAANAMVMYAKKYHLNNCTKIVLDELDTNQVRFILQEYLPNAPIKLDIVDIVAELSEGNPNWVHFIGDYIRTCGIGAFTRNIEMAASSSFNQDDSPSVSPMASREITSFDETSPQKLQTQISNRMKKLTSSISTKFASIRSPSLTITNDKDSKSPDEQCGRLSLSLNLKTSSRPSLFRPTLTSPGQSSLPKYSVKMSFLKALVLSLVDKLSSEEQLVLKCASIIGYKFCLMVLYEILDDHIRKKLQSIISTLEKYRFIVRLQKEGTMVVFHNLSMREVLYKLTPPSDAMEIHYRIALAIKKHYASNLQSQYKSLVYHYLNCSTKNSVSPTPRGRVTPMRRSPVTSPQDSPLTHEQLSMSNKQEAFAFLVRDAQDSIAIGSFVTALEQLKSAESIATTPAQLQNIRGLLETSQKELMQNNSGNESYDSLARSYDNYKSQIVKLIEEDLSSQTSTEAYTPLPPALGPASSPSRVKKAVGTVAKRRWKAKTQYSRPDEESKSLGRPGKSHIESLKHDQALMNDESIHGPAPNPVVVDDKNNSRYPDGSEKDDNGDQKCIIS